MGVRRRVDTGMEGEEIAAIVGLGFVVKTFL